MDRRFLAVIAFLIAVPAFAQEPAGCDKFKWSLDRERTLLASASATKSGDELASTLTSPVKLALVPLADARLPMAPERTPKSATSYAGYIRFSGAPQPGTYRITLSEDAWIDVIQGGHLVKSNASSGATGCDGLRKSVKFDLTSAPLIIQLSGVTTHDIAIVVTPD